jgi:hypothetical protein
VSESLLQVPRNSPGAFGGDALIADHCQKECQGVADQEEVRLCVGRELRRFTL